MQEKKWRELNALFMKAKDDLAKERLKGKSDSQRIVLENQKKRDHLRYFHEHIMKSLKLSSDK